MADATGVYVAGATTGAFPGLTYAGTYDASDAFVIRIVTDPIVTSSLRTAEADDGTRPAPTTRRPPSPA
ncbi:MAG: hypothetical protein ACT4OI_04345 [Methanobacteriota archaeon]